MRDDVAGVPSAVIDPRNNALNFLRLVFAGLVIAGHATPIGGYRTALRVGDYDLDRLAVAGFFAISGYLITRSRLRSDGARYTVRRLARIVPGYLACLVLTAFVFAPLDQAWSSGDSWSPVDAAKYVLTNLGFVHTTHLVGSTLSAVPFPGWWNGSLWTLRWELTCYLLVGVGLSVGWLRRSRWWSPVAFLGVTAAALVGHWHAVPGLLGEFLVVAPAFAAGALLQQLGPRLPISRILAAVAALALVGVSIEGFGPTLGALPIAYLCLFLGARLPGICRRINSRNDFSYGTYLYGFPVAQLLTVCGANDLPQAVFIAVCLVCVAPFAALSWFVVEKPSMTAVAAGWSPFRARELRPGAP